MDQDTREWVNRMTAARWAGGDDARWVAEAARAAAPDIELVVVAGFGRTIPDTEPNRKVLLRRRANDETRIAAVIEMFRKLGIYVSVIDNEVEFIRQAGDPGWHRNRRPFTFIYHASNERTGPGSRALLPAFCERMGLHALNSGSHARSVSWHKLHGGLILEGLGVPTPKTWQFDCRRGWLLERRPPAGLKVIAKSSFEAWAVGVTSESVFTIGHDAENRLSSMSRDIGQPVIVQQFIDGAEVSVPLFDFGRLFVPGVVELSLDRAYEKGRNFLTMQDNLEPDAVSFRSFDAEPLAGRLKDIAAACYAAFGMSCLTRVEFRIDAAGNPYVIDVAEVPSLHPRHILTYAAEAAGFKREDLAAWMIGANLIARGGLVLA